MRRIGTLGWLLAALGVSGAAQATNGYLMDGYGVSSQGLAGVAVATPQDSLAAADNPAGTAWVGNRFDLGATLFAPGYQSSIVGNGYGADGTYGGSSKLFVIPAIGYTHGLGEAFAAGVAIYGQGGMVTEYRSNPFAAFGGEGRAGVNLQQLFITPTLSWRFAGTQTLGVGLNVAWQRFSAEGLNAFETSTLAPDNLTNRGYDSSTGVGAKLGWIGEILPGLRLGLAWTSKISASHFDTYRGLFADSGSFDIPEVFAAGVSYRPLQPLLLGLDVERIRYGEVAAIANPLANLLAGNPLGSADGPGFGWGDITVVKLGAAVTLSPAFTVRAGFSHTGSPIPSDQTFFNILAPAVIRDHVSVGATWHLPRGDELSIAYTYAIKASVDGNNSIPAPFGGGNANITLQEQILAVAYGWHL